MKKKIMRLSLVILTGLLVTFALVGKSPADIVQNGDWQDALLLYDKYTKDPKGGQMVKRLRQGLMGKGYAKKFNRSLSGQKQTFDPVEVGQAIKDHTGMNIEDFIKIFGTVARAEDDIAKVRRKGYGETYTTRNELGFLINGLKILEMVDSDYAEEFVRDVIQPLEGELGVPVESEAALLEDPFVPVEQEHDRYEPADDEGRGVALARIDEEVDTLEAALAAQGDQANADHQALEILRRGTWTDALEQYAAILKAVADEAPGAVALRNKAIAALQGEGEQKYRRENNEASDIFSFNVADVIEGMKQASIYPARPNDPEEIEQFIALYGRVDNLKLALLGKINSCKDQRALTAIEQCVKYGVQLVTSLSKKDGKKLADFVASREYKEMIAAKERTFAAPTPTKAPQATVVTPPIQKQPGSAADKSLYSTLVDASRVFNKFPARNGATAPNRIATLGAGNVAVQKTIEDQAAHVFPIMHSEVKELITDFLANKKAHGSAVEKAFYASMTEKAFIDRLLTQRPLTFQTSSDNYLLRDGIATGYGGFESIGKVGERPPFVLKDYISYDEMQIAALLGVAVPTYFINNGARKNIGTVNFNKAPYQETGVYVGLVGARFEREDLMEWQHIMITPTQNTAAHGYGLTQSDSTSLLSVWESFYRIKFPTYTEAQRDTTGRFVKLPDTYLDEDSHIMRVSKYKDMYFDTLAYKERLKLVLLPFLLHANTLGQQAAKQVYCRAVGLGLGVWKVDEALQTNLMLDAYNEILSQNTFSHISDIEFLYMNKGKSAVGEIKHNGVYNQNGNNITIRFTFGNPADKLVGGDADKLLVAMYAWDGNSYPGNEYWVGSLGASGDPAAACCSTIAELQNPLINPYVLSNPTIPYGALSGAAASGSLDHEDDEGHDLVTPAMKELTEQQKQTFTDGSWSDVLRLYNTLEQDDSYEDVLKEVVVSGVKGEDTACKRTDNPFDIVDLQKRCKKEKVTIDDLIENYKDFATTVKTSRAALAKVLENPTNVALQAWVDKLRAVRICLSPIIEKEYDDHIGEIITQAQQQVVDIIGAKKDITSGTWQQALLAFEGLQKKSAYTAMVQKIVIPGFKGANNEFKRTQAFDVEQVLREIHTFNGGTCDAETFINTFTDVEKCKTTIGKVIKGNKSDKMNLVFSVFTQAIGILGIMHDATLANQIEALLVPLDDAIQKKFVWDQADIDKIQKGTWQEALQVYSSIPNTHDNEQLLAEVSAGIKGEAGQYQRTKNPFDIETVIEAIDQKLSSTLAMFVNTYGDTKKSIGQLNKLSAESTLPSQLETDVVTLQKVIDIIGMMDKSQTLAFKALLITLQGKLDVLKLCEARREALTTGSWQDALLAYDGLVKRLQEKSLFGNKRGLADFLQHVIIPGMQRTRTDEWNRVQNPFKPALFLVINTIDIAQLVNEYGTMEACQALLAQATKTSFEQDTAKALADSLKQLKSKITIIGLCDKAYADTLEALVPSIGAAITKINEIKKGLIKGSWQKILTAYSQLLGLVHDATTPEGISAGARDAMTQLIIPGLNGAANMYKRQVSVDIVNIMGEIKSLKIEGAEMTLDEFVARYGDSATYAKIVKGLIDLDTTNDSAEGSVAELARLEKAIAIIHGMNPTDATKLEPLKAQLQTFIAQAPKAKIDRQVKEAIQHGSWQQILLAYAQVKAFGDTQFTAAVRKGLQREDGCDPDYESGLSIKIGEIETILAERNMDIPNFVEMYGRGTKKCSDQLALLKDKKTTIPGREAFDAALAKLQSAIEILKLVKDTTLGNQFTKIYTEYNFDMDEVD